MLFLLSVLLFFYLELTIFVRRYEGCYSTPLAEIRILYMFVDLENRL